MKELKNYHRLVVMMMDQSIEKQEQKNILMQSEVVSDWMEKDGMHIC